MHDMAADAICKLNNRVVLLGSPGKTIIVDALDVSARRKSNCRAARRRNVRILRRRLSGKGFADCVIERFTYTSNYGV